LEGNIVCQFSSIQFSLSSPNWISLFWRRRRLPNVGLTFKSAPERSEGLAWFVHCCSAQTMTKDL
jgi:hypothetical protein